MKNTIILMALFLYILFHLTPAYCSIKTAPVLSSGLDYARAGDAALERGNLDEAIRFYTRAIESGELLPESLAIAHYNCGVAYARKANYDKAIIFFTRAIASRKLSDKTSTEARRILAIVYSVRGLEQTKKGHYDRAMADYRHAIMLKPNLAEAHYNLGNLYVDKGDSDRAIASFTRVIEIKPDHTKAYNNRGSIWKDKGCYDRAMADYIQVMEYDSDDALAHANLAWILSTCPDNSCRSGEWAVSLAKRALEIKGETPFILSTLAAAYAEAGRLKEAIETQERAIELLKKQRGEKGLLENYEKRLAHYKAGKPWRDKK